MIIKFYSLLRNFVGRNELQVEMDSAKIIDVLNYASMQTEKEFLPEILQEDQVINPGTMILLNGRNIIHLQGLQTVVDSDDEISLFPPGGGG